MNARRPGHAPRRFADSHAARRLSLLNKVTMGSVISFGIGHLELDWGKNEIFRNHSALFLRTDVKPASYYYADDVVEQRPALVRKLRDVVRRLEMVGYTHIECRQRYEAAVAAVPAYYPPLTLTFEQFFRALLRVNPADVALRSDVDYEMGELASAVLRDPEFTRADAAFSRLSRDEAEFFMNLDPYITLRLLAENPANLDLEVTWRFADVVDGGYVEEAAFYEGVPESQRCLVVTEGSSDGVILRTALQQVAADVADFFDFVDMSEHYPFTGTGNLVRFCQGLARIRIQNRILVVLDNDTAGQAAYRRISALSLPPRMKVTVLPNLEPCRFARTVGPSGPRQEDINGRGVAIECFLDIWDSPDNTPTFRWTSYDPELDAYQGALLHKEEHVRGFLAAAARGTTYNYRHLAQLWNHLIAACTK